MTDEGLELSHLPFDERNPDRFWAPLRMALQVALVRRGIVDASLDSLLPVTAESITRANLAELSALAQVAEAQSDNAACALVAAASRRQSDIISSVVAGVEPSTRPISVGHA
jgi:hypothetical protein